MPGINYVLKTTRVPLPFASTLLLRLRFFMASVLVSRSILVLISVKFSIIAVRCVAKRVVF